MSEPTTALAERVLEGEVLDPAVPTRTVRVILLRSPFSLEREEHRLAHGMTLAEMVETLGLKRGCLPREEDR